MVITYTSSVTSSSVFVGVIIEGKIEKSPEVGMGGKVCREVVSESLYKGSDAWIYTGSSYAPVLLSAG